MTLERAIGVECGPAAAAHTVLVGVVNSFGSPAQKGAALALVSTALLFLVIPAVPYVASGFSRTSLL